MAVRWDTGHAVMNPIERFSTRPPRQPHADDPLPDHWFFSARTGAE